MFLPKIEEWRPSKGRIRADTAHEKYLALGYTGSEPSTRWAIAQVKAAWRLSHTCVQRPMITARYDSRPQVILQQPDGGLFP